MQMGGCPRGGPRPQVLGGAVVPGGGGIEPGTQGNARLPAFQRGRGVQVKIYKL